MLDLILLPFFDLFSLLSCDFFEPSFVVELALGVWEWTVRVLRSSQTLLRDAAEILRDLLHLQLGLFRASFELFCVAARRLCDDVLPRAWTETMGLFQTILQISLVAVETVSRRVNDVLVDIFRTLFRPVFDWIYPLLCHDIPPPVPQRSFWSPFSGSYTCSTEEMIDYQRECAFRISSVVCAAAAFSLVLVVVAVASRFGMRRIEREVGVDRGTNTPADGAEEEAGAPVAQDRGDFAASQDQFKELQEQLGKVSQLIESQRGDGADKDTRIEELSFENRALRQNALDEKEVQSCIVCRVEPRRVVLFPCRHLCLCENCDNHNFRHCPYCRTRCTRSEKIFV